MLFIDRRYRLPRIWSNREINQLGQFFKGDIVNISGWDDRDKEGGRYKDYFPHATSYTITNFSGERGLSGIENEIFLDLNTDLPDELHGRFDLCFNHTTLEHIFDVRKAFSSICAMTRDAVLLVVPFSQTQHEANSFKDFWRFTPISLQYLFKENGLEVVYETQSLYKNAGIYLICIGSLYPERWINVLPQFKPITEAGSILGASWINRIVSSIRNRLKLKF